jgi:leader peptidase (prepilin peptidase)/N-methyltransferase
VSDVLLTLACAALGAVAGAAWTPLVPRLGARSSCAVEQPAWTQRITSPPALALGGCVSFGLVAAHLGAVAALVPALLLCALLVGITAADLRYRIVPNRLVLIGIGGGLALNVAADPSRVVELVLSMLCAGLLLLVAHLVYPAGLGLGDVKLAAMLGAFLGAPVAVAVGAGLLLATLPSLALLARHGLRRGRSLAMALGPFLALGAVLALVRGEALLHWYLQARG